MRKAPISAAVTHRLELGLFSALFLTVLVVILLVWYSNASGRPANSAGAPDAVSAVDEEPTVSAERPAESDSNTESVTMTIPLEEGGVIAIEAPPMGLTIEKWSGDDVLVIVQKTKRARTAAKPSAVDPVNIQVSRKGKNVHIETTGGAGWKDSGMDLSFKIVLPDQYPSDEVMRHEKLDTAARLTGVLWRTFHHDALEWLTR